MIDVSIIVCTYNRSSGLNRGLDSIAKAAANTDAGVELMLVDDASTDDTLAVVRKWAESALFPVNILAGEGKGVSAARNMAIRHASGRILAFMDDDCTLSPDFFSALLTLYAKDTVPVIRGGRIDVGDPRDLPYTVKRDMTPAVYTGRYPNGFIMGCNMAMSRSAQERIGFFDERFGAGALFPAAEDSEYVHRAYVAHVPVYYCPELLVYHFHGRRDVKEIYKLHKKYTVADGGMFAKHCMNWRMVSCLLGNMYRSVRELFGGKHLDPIFGFTYRSAVAGNLQGIARYILRGHRPVAGYRHY
jgi:glycosyltransferase involved in cell wall biosynthesis